MIKGWRITLIVVVLLATLVAATGTMLGFTEHATRVVVRATAKMAVVLFLFAFTASALHALWPSVFSRWLAQNRRYLGVSFAVAHFTHLAALIVLSAYFPHPFVDQLNAVTLIGGGMAYVLLAAMTLTSFAAPRRAIGERWWHRLHTTGSYYIWLIFLSSYGGRALNDVSYLPFALALLAAISIRAVHNLRRRAQAQPAAETA